MQIGMIGLGKMGGNMAERLVRAGHQVVGYDRDDKAVAALREKGGRAAKSLEDVVRQLERPAALWLMLPAGKIVDDTLETLLGLLARGDTVIDGGNSYYKDTLLRAERAQKRGVAYVDAGVSGGIWGLKNGYCMMIGGTKEAVANLQPVLASLAPSAEHGFAHVGPTGAGHFVKMVHNGIEYGLMEAYAEGFAILEKKSELELDLGQVAEVWRHGSVVRSWLLDLTVEALTADPNLDKLGPSVADSGEGRWTVSEAIDLDVPAPAITVSLLERLRSRVTNSFADRLLAAMRHGFGGHAVEKR